ncbi:hypothetical protein [Larkinella terrae]|uniref:Uncharacterized protein n=1 Tax=Larkinella terrae TaxID=2025311 RepID=A0A7K0EHP9_9BACT|nr:hypothetical protein [Larkinella terrae]MRS61242.1 hypothetical protein [Larkinella terrae]
MEQTTSKYQMLMESLKSQGKLHSLEEIFTPEVTMQINSQMEAVRREYRRKDAESKQEAALVILNA